ncbi:hypothetical protein GGF37_002312 [Kickxella alabastrina]|nr:hypothetical protein GGF37_002312 [Kickxella alabastrina]
MDNAAICMAMHKWMHQFLVEFKAINTVVLVIGSLIRLVEDPSLMAVRLSEQPKYNDQTNTKPTGNGNISSHKLDYNFISSWIIEDVFQCSKGRQISLINKDYVQL